MKKVHVIIWVFLTISVFAQQKQTPAKITVGPAYEVVDAKFKEYFTFKDRIIGVKTNNSGKGFDIGFRYTLQSFNTKTLTLEKVKDYNDFDKDAREEGIIQLQDKLYLFYSVWDKNKDLEQLFVREIDVNKCEFIGQGKKLFEVPYKLEGMLAGRSILTLQVYNKFNFCHSFDENKLVVHYANKDSFKKIGYKLFDINLNVISEKEVELPETKFVNKYIDYSVDKDGNFYLTSKNYRDNSLSEVVKKEVNGEKVKEINYDIEIFKFDAKSTKMTAHKVLLDEDKNIIKMKMFESIEGNIICAGYYAEGGSKNRRLEEINGVFKFEMTNNGKKPTVMYYDIPLEVINQNQKSRKVRKNEQNEEHGDVAFANLEPRIVYVAKDGGLVLIGEQFYEQEFVLPSQGRIETKTITHYDDVLLTKINKDGTLGWMKKIAKRQTKTESSFKLVRGENDLYIVYVDNLKNLNIESTEVPAVSDKFLTAVKVNYNTGDLKKQSLFDIGEVKDQKIYQFKMDRIIESALDEFVLEMYKKDKEDILIKVDLK